MRIATPFMALNVGWSVACLDIKGDFRRLTEEHRRRAGNIILALDPFGKSSDGFNPIAALDLDELFPDNALELAQSIIRVEGKEPHWPQAAQEWVAALIMYVRLVLPNGGSFADVRALLGQNDENIRTMVLSPGATIKGVEHFFRYKSFKLAGMMETAARTKWDEIGIKAARFGDITPENRELHSVISTALTQTSWLDSIPVRRDLAKQPFDFGLMKERPVTVYIVLPPRRLSTHSAWVRLIFASIVQKLMREAEAGKVPVAILCDEFAALAGSSIGTSGEGADGFPVISKNMSVFRQYGIKLITIWQDLAQAKRIFGDNGFETFLANCRCLPGLCAAGCRDCRIPFESNRSDHARDTSDGRKPKSKSRLAYGREHHDEHQRPIYPDAPYATTGFTKHGRGLFRRVFRKGQRDTSDLCAMAD